MLLTYCLIIAVISIVSGFLALSVRPTHRRMQLIISFVAGVMAGVAVLELLPEAIHLGDVEKSMFWLLIGFAGLFLLERFLPSHCHDVAEAGEHTVCGHDHQLTWMGAAIGLTLHSLVEGAAIAAAFDAGGTSLAIGLGIAVALHKPFDALTLVAMMRIKQKSTASIMQVNVGFGFVVVLGAFAYGLVDGIDPNIVSITLACSAGMFLCIALCDLLPELQFHGHDKIALTVSLLLGLAVAWGITRLHDCEYGEHHETTLQLTIHDANDAKL